MSTVTTAAVCFDENRSDKNNAIVAGHERHALLDHVLNLRTLAGIQTRDAKRFRENRLYRSDALSRLSQSDREQLASLSLQVVTDFRSKNEALAEPDLLPSEQTRLQFRPVTVLGTIDRHDLLKSLRQLSSAQESMQWMSGLYRSMVSGYTPVYRDWLHSLLNEDQYPQLYHCTSGKDRTGVATALLLKVLGVSGNIILEDFLLSNHFLEGRIEARLQETPFYSQLLRDLNPELLQPILGVRKEYLEAVFSQVNQEYGYFERYVSQGLKLNSDDVAKLKALLLEPITAD